MCKGLSDRSFDPWLKGEANQSNTRWRTPWESLPLPPSLIWCWTSYWPNLMRNQNRQEPQWHSPNKSAFWSKGQRAKSDMCLGSGVLKISSRDHACWFKNPCKFLSATESSEEVVNSTICLLKTKVINHCLCPSCKLLRDKFLWDTCGTDHLLSYTSWVLFPLAAPGWMWFFNSFYLPSLVSGCHSPIDQGYWKAECWEAPQKHSQAPV